MPTHIDAKQAALAQQFLNEQARESFHAFQRRVLPLVTDVSYVDADHIAIISHALQDVADGKVRRLLLATPPRHGKSYLSSIAFPAYVLGRNPSLRVITASYGSDLAYEFSGKCRQILQAPQYQAIFPGAKLRKALPPVDDLELTAGGRRFATSIGGTLTGMGADILILDDPIKAADAASQTVREGAFEWLKASAMTRFDKPAEGAVIVIMQRLHQDDVIGRLKAEGGWTLIELPARFDTKRTYKIPNDWDLTFSAGEILFPQRFNEAVLDELRKELGDAAFNAQYLQRPTPPGGHLFKLDRFGRVDLEVNHYRDQYEAFILSHDPGVSADPASDYSALTVWGVRGPDLFLLIAQRGRWTYKQQLERLTQYRKKCDALIVERAHIGIALLEDMATAPEGQKGLFGFNPKFNKTARAETAAYLVEKGRLHLPREAPWLAAYEQELADFPHGGHDDWVDSTSQLTWKLMKDPPAKPKLSAYKTELIAHVSGFG